MGMGRIPALDTRDRPPLTHRPGPGTASHPHIAGTRAPWSGRYRGWSGPAHSPPGLPRTPPGAHGGRPDHTGTVSGSPRRDGGDLSRLRCTSAASNWTSWNRPGRGGRGCGRGAGRPQPRSCRSGTAFTTIVHRYPYCISIVRKSGNVCRHDATLNGGFFIVHLEKVDSRVTPRVEGVFILSTSGEASDGGEVITDQWGFTPCMGQLRCPATAVPISPNAPGRWLTSSW